MSTNQSLKERKKLTLYYTNEYLTETPEEIEKKILESSTDYENAGISFYLPLPSANGSQEYDPTSRVPQKYFKYTISKTPAKNVVIPKYECELPDANDQAPFTLVATGPFFSNPELTFKLYNPVYLEEKGYYVLFYGEKKFSPFKIVALEYFLSHFEGKAKILPTISHPLEGSDLPFVAFTEEVYEALLEGNSTQDKEQLRREAENTARELWESMGEEERSIYDRKVLSIQNVFPDQLLNLNCNSAGQDLFSNGGNAESTKDAHNKSLRQELHIIDATVLLTNSLETKFIQYLSQRSKLVETTKHLSLYTSELSSDQPQIPTQLPPERLTKITITTNKINCTREQYGDIFDLFILKPYKAEYDQNSYRKLVAYFLNHEDVKTEIERLRKFTPVYNQITVQTENKL